MIKRRSESHSKRLLWVTLILSPLILMFVMADITLNSPLDNQYYNLSNSSDISFNCTSYLSGSNLHNISLWTWDVSGVTITNMDIYFPEISSLSLYDDFGDGSLNTSKWTKTGTVTEGSGEMTLSGNEVTSTVTTVEFDAIDTGGTFQFQATYTSDGGSTANIYASDGATNISLGFSGSAYKQYYFDKEDETVIFRTSADGSTWGSWSSEYDVSSLSNYYVMIKITSGGSTAKIVVDDAYYLSNNLVNHTHWVNSTIKRTTNWTCQACNSTSCEFGTNRTIFITGLQITNEDYEEEVTESTIQELIINITTTGEILEEANLVYDGVIYSGSVESYGENKYGASRELLSPSVSSDSVKQFYWNLLFNDSTSYNTTLTNQTILNLGIDDCGVHSNVLFNFTIYDEQDKTLLSGSGLNTSGLLNLQIYDLDTGSLIINYNNSYDDTNPFAVCLENSLTSEDNYLLDLELRYTADGYAKEFYYIENEQLTDEDLNTSIGLYLLDNNTAQPFKISYKDERFLPVSGGLIQLQRRYLDEGLYRTVEQSKMDGNGESILQVELEEVVYTINILVDGEIDATFDDIRFYCPNPTLEECSEDLYKFESYVDIRDFATINGLSFEFDYNDTSREVSATYSVLSGSSREVVLNVSLFDAFGNQSVCNDRLISSSGTLSCVIPTTFGNTSVITELYSNDVFIGRSIIKIGRAGYDTYGSSLIIIGIVAILLLIGIGAVGEPVVSIVFLIIGLLLLVTLNIIFTPSWIGTGATFLWFIIAMIIVMIKGGSR